MNKKIYVFSIVYLILTCTDIFVTYLSTPDLTFEGNPLVTVLNLGWGSLILANLLGFLLYIFCCYYCFGKYRTIVCKSKNIGEYVSQIAFGRKDKFLWIFYKVPKNWAPIAACLSYEVIWAFILGRVITIFEWYLWHNDLSFKNVYFEFRESFAFGRMDITILVAVAFILVNHWFFKEYEKSKAAIEKTKESVLCI